MHKANRFIILNFILKKSKNHTTIADAPESQFQKKKTTKQPDGNSEDEQTEKLQKRRSIAAQSDTSAKRKYRTVSQDMINEKKLEVLEAQLNFMKEEHSKKMELLEVQLAVEKENLTKAKSSHQ